ncbi:MAG: exosortase/archaeosortase family protein [Verrucomicrobiales bacterium]|jgi:exosortase/archaeosortase family protein
MALLAFRPPSWLWYILVPPLAVMVAFVINVIRVTCLSLFNLHGRIDLFDSFHVGPGSQIFSGSSVWAITWSTGGVIVGNGKQRCARSRVLRLSRLDVAGWRVDDGVAAPFLQAGVPIGFTIPGLPRDHGRRSPCHRMGPRASLPPQSPRSTSDVGEKVSPILD